MGSVIPSRNVPSMSDRGLGWDAHVGHAGHKCLSEPGSPAPKEPS